MKERVREEEKNGKREGELKIHWEEEEDETVSAKRRCVFFNSAEAFDIFSLGEDLEGCVLNWSDLLEDPGELLECDLGTRMDGPVVLVVTDVFISFSLVVTGFCDEASIVLIGNFMNRSPLLSTKKRSLDWENSQEEMRYEGSSVKAPPPSRRRMMPPAPQPSSSAPIEELQWQTGMEVQGSGWSYRNKNDCLKFDV